MKRTYWNADNTPLETTLDFVLYDIRRDDAADGLLLDAVTLTDITEDMAGFRLTLDALLSPYNKLETKMNMLEQVMNRAGTEVKVTSRQLSEPFTQNGTANVVALFELSDGQTVSIYFHNPDTTPKKIMPTDELISWKWLLNKKDITIVVAPERGKDLNVRQVATRIMKLAEKNSPAFQRANGKRAERMAQIEGLRTEITQLEGTLKGKLNRIEALKVEVEDREILAADKSGQVGQGIDPVTRANIEAAPISAAIKKKVLAYLEANPHSHQLAEKETPAIKKAKDTILDNLQIALKAEIMALTPLIYVDPGNDLALILGEESITGKLRIYIGKERMSCAFSTAHSFGKQFFDSTKTLEELREWNFSLPFDLDVKAFVANVIKPIVDELLSKQAGKQAEQAAPEAENTGPFRHEGFNIYPLKMKMENGDIQNRWAVQSIDNLERERAGERQVGGDDIVNTQEEAKVRAEHQAVRQAEHADWIAKIEKEKADEAAKKAESIAALADFVTYRKLSVPSAEKARLTLSKKVSADGKILTLKDFIESLVAEGRFIGEDNGMRTLEHPHDGRFRDEKQLSKTGMDYAEFLIQKRDEGQSISQPITGDIDREIESLRSETDMYAFDARLDALAEKIEAEGLMEQYDKPLNELADIYEALLAAAEREVA